VQQAAAAAGGDGLAEGGSGGDAAQEDDEAADGEAGRHGDARGGARRAARVHAGDDVRQGRRGARALLSRQNQAGETPLFVAAEYGYVALVGEMIRCHDVATASIKARSGYDALHIAAKQGDTS